MAGPNRKAPVGVFHFQVLLWDVNEQKPTDERQTFFRSVSGLKSETEVVDQPVGGNSGYTHKMIGIRKWPNLTLKQGFTGDPAIFKLRFSPRRINGEIIQFGPYDEKEKLTEVGRWAFTNGYPVKWEGPDLDAMKNELAIETLVIAHEGLEYIRPGAPKEEPKTEPFSGSIKFGPGEWDVSKNPALQAKLKEMAAKLGKDPAEVVSHTDTVGSDAANIELSNKRAQSTAAFLTSQGANVVLTQGKGPAECRAKFPDIPSKNDPDFRRTDITKRAP